MKNSYLKTLTASLVGFLLMSGVFVNQALAGTVAARIVVAKSGGNYTTITAALNAITPTATNPYVIEVWPGVYTETGTVNMKSYVHLKGSGRDVTTVKTSLGTTASVIVADGLTAATISGLTITGGSNGIQFRSWAGSNSITISDNTVSNNNYGIVGKGQSNSSNTNYALITGNKVMGNAQTGIEIVFSSATITGNYITGTGLGYTNTCSTGVCVAIFIENDTVVRPIVISGNIVTQNEAVGIRTCTYGYTTIANNIITDNSLGGIFFATPAVSGSVTNNKVVDNGTVYADIAINPTSTTLPNISFNVFNSITGTAGVGSYNVSSDGNPITVP